MVRAAENTLKEVDAVLGAGDLGSGAGGLHDVGSGHRQPDERENGEQRAGHQAFARWIHPTMMHHPAAPLADRAQSHGEAQ